MLLLVGLAIAAVIAVLIARFYYRHALIPFGFVVLMFSIMFVAFRESVSWLGNDVPLVADAGGTDLVIGLVRYVLAGDTIHIAAYDTNGRRRWETESLGKYVQVYRSKLAIVGDAIILTSPRGDVECRDVKTGVLRWQTSLHEVVTEVGAGAAEDEIALHTADNQWMILAAKDGSLRPNSRPRPAVAQPDPTSVQIEGMSVDRLVVHEDGPRIALGHRVPGTPVPMIAAVDVGDVVIWKCDVPATDPLTTRSNVEYCALDRLDVAVIYERGAESILTMFDRITGARRFETTFPSPFVEGLSLRKDAVVVSAEGLRMFDRATGQPRARIGSM
jgi:outer membrane protein assembly factor BamB